MKRILLPILSFAVLTSGAFAEGPATGLYRPLPKQSPNENLGKQHAHIATLVPTQFYYLRDSVISYRYSLVDTYSGTPDKSDYLGPVGARFAINDDLPQSATVRNFAAVTRRGQPGVGMVAPTPVKTTIKKTVKKTASTTIVPASQELAQK
jgi:hypothetical protein